MEALWGFIGTLAGVGGTLILGLLRNQAAENKWDRDKVLEAYRLQLERAQREEAEAIARAERAEARVEAQRLRAREAEREYDELRSVLDTERTVWRKEQADLQIRLARVEANQKRHQDAISGCLSTCDHGEMCMLQAV